MKLSDPNLNSRLGSLGTVAQSTCFSFPDPNALVICSTTLVGPTMTDVPVSMMPRRFELVLQLVPLKTTSVISTAQQFCILSLQYLKSPVQYFWSTPPRTNADPFCPAFLVKQNENEFPETFPCLQRRSKIKGHPLTLIDGQAIPKIPSNLDARKLIPSSLVTCPKRLSTACNPATVVVSWPMNPTTAPDPYVMLKAVPLYLQVELLALSKYLWRQQAGESLHSFEGTHKLEDPVSKTTPNA